MNKIKNKRKIGGLFENPVKVNRFQPGFWVLPQVKQSTLNNLRILKICPIFVPSHVRHSRFRNHGGNP